jgi:site-specific recombinase XerD
VLPSWWNLHDADATGRVVLAAGAETISHRALERWFDCIVAKAGLKRPMQNAHMARHTYARLMLEMSARLEELQKFLGHASIRTTERLYGWLTELSATTLARSRVYGETLRLVKPKKKEGRRAAA